MLRKFLHSMFAAGALALGGCGEVGNDNNEENHHNNGSGGGERIKYWEILEYSAPMNVQGYQGMLVSGLDSFFQAVLKEDFDERKIAVNEHLSNLFFEKFRKDRAAQDMGYNMECVKRYVMPRVTKIELDKPDGVGTWNAVEGVVSLPRNDSRPHIMVYVATHEYAHVFNYGEDSSELFYENISGISIDRPRDDWVYGTYQVRGILKRAKQLGKEKQFWASLSSEEALRDMWTDLSPKYIVEGKEELLLSYDEWQAIRKFSDDGASRAKHSLILIDISARLEQAYTSNQSLKKNLRDDIVGLLEIAEPYGKLTGSIQTAFIIAGRELSDKVYNDKSVHDKLSKLRNIGFCYLQGI